jgi:hypothetical protein
VLCGASLEPPFSRPLPNTERLVLGVHPGSFSARSVGYSPSSGYLRANSAASERAPASRGAATPDAPAPWAGRQAVRLDSGPLECRRGRGAGWRRAARPPPWCRRCAWFARAAGRLPALRVPESRGSKQRETRPGDARRQREAADLHQLDGHLRRGSGRELRRHPGFTTKASQRRSAESRLAERRDHPSGGPRERSGA